MAIDRDIMNRRSVPGTSMGPAGRGSITFGMDRPQTLESLRRNILPPRGTPMPMPTPMPNIRAPRRGEGPAGMTQQEMRRQTGSFDMPNPSREGIMDALIDNYENLLPSFVRPAAATVDPSDYRTIIKMIEQGLDPEDYIASSGIMSALPQETQMAELTQGQKDFIRGQGGDQFQSRESLMNKIMTPQGGFDRGPFMGIFGGAQEPTTREELDEFLDSGMVG